MLQTILLAGSILVTHAPGWSDPVISIAESSGWDQRKDIEVTDGNHIHQIWDHYQGQTLTGYNVVLPDGTPLGPDTLISRDAFSGYPSSCLVGDDFFGTWRESSPIWYAVNDHDGHPVVPATLFTSAPWVWWVYIAVDGDSLGRVHMTYDAPGGIWYSVFVPGPTPLEIFRDTIPDSRGCTLLDVSGDRVHILFMAKTNNRPMYVQYNLDGNMVLAPIAFNNPASLQVDDRWSLCSDYLGNACVFDKESINSTSYLLFYRIDRVTGELLADGKIIYTQPTDISVKNPQITPGPWDGSLHLLWLETELGTGYPRLIRHAVIDLDGNFLIAPYTAYDYTDEDPEELRYLHAASNDEGDLFINYSEVDMSIPGYWIRLGWLDHNWLGIEEGGGGDPADFRLRHSTNPFDTSVSITVEGSPAPGQLVVYDLSGRMVRTISRNGEQTFLWDGCSADGDELPAGTYIIQGASEGRLASVTVVKL
jgi:hypothetical protein